MLNSEILDTFRGLLDEAKASGDREPTAMNLATVDSRGRVHSRIVLLKAIDEKGLRFFTNYESAKAGEIAEHSQVALCFHWKQIREGISAAGVEGVIDDGVLATWPKNGSRGGNNLYIAPDSGLRDYPSFTEYGVQVRTEFRRAISYGAMMTIQSSIKNACGQWKIIRIDYDLQSNTPGGSWYAILDGTPIGAPVTER